jgi:hypothetical protein
MDNAVDTVSGPVLTERLHQFLLGPTVTISRLHIVLSELRARGWSAVFFGGLLRDLAAFGSSAVPRDIDIVVAGATNDEIFAVFEKFVVRKTRFGGMVIDLGPLEADIWSLSSTWAFQTGEFGNASFSSLPNSTFLNVEAVAIDALRQQGARCVFESGFFDALAKQEVEINFEPNPFPALCVVRSVVTLQSLRFSAGPRLIQYILNWRRRLGIPALLDAQLSHYGRIVVKAKELDRISVELAAGIAPVDATLWQA